MGSIEIILLFISLAVAVISIPNAILTYKKDKSKPPQAAANLGKKLLVMAIIVAVLNGAAPILNQFKSKPQPPLTKKEIEEASYRALEKYMGENLKNPSVEEAKSEFEEELATAFKETLNLYKQGNEAYDKKRFEKSISIYNNALNNVETPALYRARGNSYLVTGKFELALKDFEKARSLYQKNGNRQGEGYVLGNLGIALYYLNHKEKALDTYNKALEIHPDYAYGWSNKGVVLFDLEQYKEAVKSYNKALKIKPREASVLVNKGAALAKLDRKEEALEAFNKALEIDPNYTDAWSNKGVALSKLGQKEEEIAAYDKAIDYYTQALAIFEQIKSPYAELIRKHIAKLKAEMQ